MKNKYKKIVLEVDKKESSDKKLSRVILAHKEISDNIKSAYQFSHSEIKMNFLAERVVAMAKSRTDYSLLEKFKIVCTNSFSLRRFAWSTAFSIIVIASLSFIFLNNKNQKPQELASFVIFQTQEGDSVVRYFNYKHINKNDKI